MKAKLSTSFRPVYRNVKRETLASVNVKIDSGADLLEIYHYHPQMELILLRNCYGNMIVGTYVGAIEQDEILLIGKNTPHGFLHKWDRYANEDNITPYAVVVQFDEDFIGKDFYSIPESMGIKKLLSSASKGLLVKEEKKARVAELMEHMAGAKGFEKILLLLKILSIVEEQDESYRILSDTEAPSGMLLSDDHARLQEIWDYTMQHFDQPIRIEDVAERVNLTKESFCRFFKMKTKMTYMEYLFAYRIEKAIAMIMENNKSIKEIGYSCGFVSLSNFYHQFKKIMHCSPLEYQSELFEKLRK